MLALVGQAVVPDNGFGLGVPCPAEEPQARVILVGKAMRMAKQTPQAVVVAELERSVASPPTNMEETEEPVWLSRSAAQP